MPEADLVLNGLVGAIGLAPTLAALAQGKTVAMANKEPLVMAGGLILQQARRGGGTVLPLDSEPNAIWQCLKGENRKSLKRIILTALWGAVLWAQPRANARHHPRAGPRSPHLENGSQNQRGFGNPDEQGL